MSSLKSERYTLLRNLNTATDKFFTILSFVWLGIVVLEFTVGVNEILEYTSLGIWALFIGDFIIELIIAPNRKKYLLTNWLNALALLLPALRVFRIFQSLKLAGAARSLRSLNLLKAVASLNRSIETLRKITHNYGIRYLAPFSAIVLFAGAGGVLFFENPTALKEAGAPNTDGIANYGDAVWWTVMLMTTIGSAYWPQTLEGRVLTVVISFYSIAIFGYVTATLASILIEKTKSNKA